MQPEKGDYHRLTKHDVGSFQKQKIQKSKNPNNSNNSDRPRIYKSHAALSHVTIPGNKTADDAAKEALDDEIQHTKKHLPTEKNGKTRPQQ
jgi:hypothetical protein